MIEFAPDRWVQPWELLSDEHEEIEVIGYTPHNAQWQLHECPARFRILTCGRRWGKTLACVNEMWKAALERNGALCWWVAPFYRTTEIGYRLAKQANPDLIKKAIDTKMRIELVNGSVLEFRSAENEDALRGEGVDFLIVDEAAMVKKTAWEEALRPTLSDRKGRAIFISTPKGRNWFYDLFQRGQNPDFPDYASFTFPTSSNPFIDPAELEDVKKTLPADVYGQEYEAEFLKDGAGVFRGVYDCIGGELSPPEEGKRYVAGWDIARTTDYSVVTIMDAETGQVVAFDRFNQVDWKTQLNRVESLVKEYHDAKLWLDATGVGDPLLEQLQDRGLDVEGFTFTATSKKQLVHNLQRLISEQGIRYPNIPELLYELEIFEYQVTKSGNLTYSAPPGAHDDCVMSLGLVAWGFTNDVPPQLFV